MNGSSGIGAIANFGSILYRCLLIEFEMMKFSQVFTRDAIASDHSWADLPEMEHTWARPEHYVRAYLSDPDAWWWSTNDYTQGESEVVLKRVLAIIAQARMPEHEKALGQLGSGPLENMMSDGLLDILALWMPFSAPMCHALDSIRLEVEPLTVQKRLHAMLRDSQRDLS